MNIPLAPAYERLPARRERSTRGGPTLCSIPVAVEVVTPILGGGSQTRATDDVDVIRPATVRGHLRFWWRALRGHEFTRAEDLYNAESLLWGQAASDEGGRSAVEVRIELLHTAKIDDSDILERTPGAYALWPARAEERTNTPAALRRKPGTRFRLTLIAPKDREAEVRNVLRAWLLFGGYGSRTRRGLGSLTVIEDAQAWLPTTGMRQPFTTLFGRDVFTPLPSIQTVDTPCLAGAALHVGKAIGKKEGDAVKAWTMALEWLKEFRQGTSGGAGNRAREPGTGKPEPNRPSISNWPEPDNIRHLTGKKAAHPPRHNATPVWPRAGFGLPIIGRFQKNARNGGYLDEPDGFELRWRAGGEPEHDRLASPLIVKALPLADGSFLPCALWLNRAYPCGEIVLKGVNGSAAPFDLLVAPGDEPQFSALAGKSTLRDAFLDWMHGTYLTTVVAP